MKGLIVAGVAALAGVAGVLGLTAVTGDSGSAAQPATAVVAAPATTTADESLAQRLDRLSEAGGLADAALARAKAAAAERGLSTFADLPTSALPDVPWFDDDDHSGDDDDHGWDREHESGDREDD